MSSGAKPGSPVAPGVNSSNSMTCPGHAALSARPASLASASIGRAIARLLAAEGVKLAIAARRRALLEEVATEITDAGVRGERNGRVRLPVGADDEETPLHRIVDPGRVAGESEQIPREGVLGRSRSLAAHRRQLTSLEVGEHYASASRVGDEHPPVT